MKKFMLTMTASVVMAMIGFVGQAVAEVTVVSWGGAYTMSQQKAYADTFSDSSVVGGKVKFINYNGGLGEIRTQVESGTITWDIADVLPHEAELAATKVFSKNSSRCFRQAPDGTSMDDDIMVLFLTTVLYHKYFGLICLL